MKLKEIKTGMIIRCKTQEEANKLCDAVGASQQWKEYWERYKDDTCYQILSDGIYNYGKSISYGIKNITEFSELIIPEMSAEEAIKAYAEMCHTMECEYCKLNRENNGLEKICRKFCMENTEEALKIITDWKSDHEKKEPEIETVDICRIIELLPDSRKRCVHEEDIKPDPELPFGGDERQMVEEILKRYCMEHDGKFIAVHEVVSRVKAVE